MTPQEFIDAAEHLSVACGQIRMNSDRMYWTSLNNYEAMSYFWGRQAGHVGRLLLDILDDSNRLRVFIDTQELWWRKDTREKSVANGATD